MEFVEGRLYVIGDKRACEFAYLSKVGTLMEYVRPVPAPYGNTKDSHVLRVPGSAVNWHIERCDILPRSASTNEEALTLLKEGF